MVVFTGNQAYHQFGFESTFGTEQTTRNYVMGLNEQISGFSINNSNIPLKMLGMSTITKFAFGRFDGSYSTSFVLSNPWCFLHALPYKSSSGSASPYTHTLRHDKYESTGSNIDNDTIPDSISHEIGFDMSSDMAIVAIGSIVESIGIDVSVGDLVNCTTQHKFTKWAKKTSLDSTPATDPIDFPYTFEHGSITVAGTEVAEVQRANMNISTGLRHLYGIGSRNASSVYRSMHGVTGGFDVMLTDDTWIDYSTGRTEVASLDLKFTNGASSSDERSINLKVSGLVFDPYSISTIQPNEPVQQSLSWIGKSVKVVAVNHKGDPPA